MKNKPPLLSYDEAKAQGLWFMSKRFGYGWVPINWQGWLTTLIATALMVIDIASIAPNKSPTQNEILVHSLILCLLLVIMLTICVKKGEKAYWRWGK